MLKQFEKKCILPPDEIVQLEITPEHYPQGSASHLAYPIPLEEYGYVEEEYLIRGRSNLYTWPDPEQPPYIRIADAPYATRILVRKPADPDKFSGCVMVEAFNTATGLDHASSGWGYCYRNILSSGDAWIGYTMGREGIGFDALVKFDPERYDVGLGFPNPIPPEDRHPRGYNILQDRKREEGAPKPVENADFDRGLAHEMFFQLCAMAKRGGPGSPLWGYHVKKCFGVGVNSYNVYLAAFGDGMTVAGGEQAADGYLMYMSGPGLALCREDPMFRPDDPRARVTGPVPIIKVETSGDLLGVGGHPVWGILWRTEDRDEPGKMARWYEIGGAYVNHWAHHQRQTYPEKAEYTRIGLNPPAPKQNIVENYLSRYIMAGAWRNLKDWVLKGTPPPRQAEPLRTVGSYPEVVFATDELGNHIGGVPNPYTEVPAAVFDDLGNVQPLPPEVMKKLYRNRADYLDKVAAFAEKMAADRWILPEAAAELIEQAYNVYRWEP